MTEHHPLGSGATYAGSGVSVAAGEAAVDLMRKHTEKTYRPEVLGGIGGFASLFKLPVGKYREPVLASSSDGVGTKTAIAQALDVHDTIGIDLVAMVVDDLVACGAEPLFLQDYIACGSVVPEKIATIVSGIAHGCNLAGCALVGGETAEHPGLMNVDDYDLAATGVGIVEMDEILGADRVRPGDAVIALGSSGVHANGFSMVRRILLEIQRLPLEGYVEEFGRPLGVELLEPTRIYALDCLALGRDTEVHAYAHITGGGLVNNLARVIPRGVTAKLDRRAWQPLPVFGFVAGHGRVERSEMELAFNMGVGMVAVVKAEDADRAQAILTARHVPNWVLGTVEASDADAPRVTLTGDYPRF